MSEVQAEAGGEAQNDGADLTAEREARRQGWRPQEEFRGNEADWVDAHTYIQRGREIRMHSKAENERLTRELAAARADAAEMKGTIEEIRAYHADMEERAINTAIDRLKKEKRTALAAGDAVTAADIDEDIQELKDAPRMGTKLGKKDETVAPTPTPTEPPEITQWKIDSAAWYNEDPENEDLVAYANGMAQRVGMRKDLSLQEKADEVTRRTKAAFPDRFEKKPRAGLTPGGGEGGGSGRKTNNSVASLPEDAKQAGQRYVKQGLYKTMEDYAKEYWNQPGMKAR